MPPLLKKVEYEIVYSSTILARRWSKCKGGMVGEKVQEAVDEVQVKHQGAHDGMFLDGLFSSLSSALARFFC